MMTIQKYMKCPALLFLLLAALICLGCRIAGEAVAAVVYENYTFTTLAGPQESPGWHDGTGNEAGFNHPIGVAADKAGNVYVADFFNHTIRKITPAGVVMTLAGRAGISGVSNGTGSAARFNSPSGLAVDGAGNLLVAEWGNHSIRRITPSGIVTTLAGAAGVYGATNGISSEARFHNPFDLAVDGAGNVYVADSGNSMIRKITPEGVVTTLAGSAGLSGADDGTGSAARFNNMSGITADAGGNVFVADTGNHTVRRITPAGVVTTLAGQPGVTGSEDGVGGAARFNNPYDVAVDGAGKVYVADLSNHTIRVIATDGRVTTLAGAAGEPGTMDGRGSAARFYSPAGLATDGDGNVYVSGYADHTIRKVTPTGVVTTTAGKIGGPGTANGPAGAARFSYPSACALDAVGNIYVTDLANNSIRRVSRTGVVTLLAGAPGETGSANGTGVAARFNTPVNLVLDGGGNVFITDSYNHTIRRMTPDGSVTTILGYPGANGTVDGFAGAARFNNPSGITVDSLGNLFIADTQNHTIRKVTPSGLVTTFAGSPGKSGNLDGTGTAALFNFPQNIAVDRRGNLYVTDSANHIIRKITPSAVVTTFAGAATVFGAEDGASSDARFYLPFGIAVDGFDNVYVTENGSHTIRKISPAGRVTTLAGSAGRPGSDDGSGSFARFFTPEGIAVDPEGNLYVADASNHSIRKGYPAPKDIPTVDMPSGNTGVSRQLGVSNLTTISWSWSVVRRPAGSTGQLSATATVNPTFVPDVADLYVIRFEGTDSSGRLGIGTVELDAGKAGQLIIDYLSVSPTTIILGGAGGNPGGPFSVLLSSNLSLPLSGWTLLPGGAFDASGRFSFTNNSSLSGQFFQIKAQ
jgi:sugar lactone lactonase YvrE